MADFVSCSCCRLLQEYAELKDELRESVKTAIMWRKQAQQCNSVAVPVPVLKEEEEEEEEVLICTESSSEDKDDDEATQIEPGQPEVSQCCTLLVEALISINQQPDPDPDPGNNSHQQFINSQNDDVQCLGKRPRKEETKHDKAKCEKTMQMTNGHNTNHDDKPNNDCPCCCKVNGESNDAG